jgi:hypothetical protein
VHKYCSTSLYIFATQFYIYKCIQIALDYHDYTIYTVEFFVNICIHFELNVVGVAVASGGRMARQTTVQGHETGTEREREREREREL